MAKRYQSSKRTWPHLPGFLPNSFLLDETFLIFEPIDERIIQRECLLREILRKMQTLDSAIAPSTLEEVLAFIEANPVDPDTKSHIEAARITFMKDLGMVIPHQNISRVGRIASSHRAAYL